MKKIKAQWEVSSLLVKMSILCLPVMVLLVTVGIVLIMGRSKAPTTVADLLEGDLFSESQVGQDDAKFLNGTAEQYGYERENQTEASNMEAEDTESQAMIYVDIKGAVLYPNVYALPMGSRLFDAILLAGGLLPHAATQTLNQAQLLADQTLIYIYGVDELEQVQVEENDTLAPPMITLPDDVSSVATLDDAGLNINSASLTELQTLPGIGPKKAEAIIQHRELNGSFSTIEAIMEVSGIGDKTFEQLMPLIRVN